MKRLELSPASLFLPSRSKARSGASALSLVLALLFNGLAAGAAEAAPQHRAGEVVVRFKAGAGPLVRGRFAADHGLLPLRDAPRLRCSLMALPASLTVDDAVERLAADPRVDLVQPNYVYRAAQFSPSDPSLDPNDAMHQYGFRLTNLPSLWRGSDGGAGRTIAIVDTGIDATHSEFEARVVAGWDFIDDDADPSDLNGHGTHVAGIAAAADDGAGTVGAAPNAILLSVRVLDDTAAGTTLTVASGIDYASGADVINLSIQVNVIDCLVRETVAAAYAAGSVLVASSGNGGGSSLTFPARYEEVIAVGAVNAGGAVWIDSQYGAELDVVAPGVAIWSTWPGGAYNQLSGTSMASPFVAGICALLLNEFPGMQPWELELFLRGHARDVDGAPQGVSGNHDGYGMLGFGSLRDFGNAPLLAAWSDSAFHEWLGAEVTGESSVNDLTPVGFDDGDDAQPDLDGFPNASGQDGGDDGLFPASHPKLPLLPPHLAVAQTLDVDVSVGDHLGARYDDAGEDLRVRIWADWDSNDLFSGDELLCDTVTSPAGWADDTTTLSPIITGKDDHFRGDPLRLRARVTHDLYDPAPPGSTGAQAYGEVEDHEVLNFVEDFDLDFHAGVFATMDGSWAVVDDDPDFFPHWGQWHYARAQLSDCQPGVMVDELLVLPESAQPPLDLRELTAARLRLWAVHRESCPLGPCEGTVDQCRISVRRYADPGGSPTEEVTLFEFPHFTPGCGGNGFFMGDLDLDLSAFLGDYVRVVVHHNTDNLDTLQIDDVVVFGYDDRAPAAPTPGAASLAADLFAGFGFDHPDENAPAAPGDARAAAYGARLAVAPFDWDGAYRLTPRDFWNASSLYPVPGAAGASDAAGFLAPTTFPDLILGLRAEDETANAGALVTMTFANAPTFGVAVVGPPAPIAAAPGQEVQVDFLISNTSAALDAFQIGVLDTQSPPWIRCPVLRTRVLAGGDGALETVTVDVPLTAAFAESDTITLIATSLSDGSVVGLAAATVEVLLPGPVGDTICVGTGNCPCGNDDPGAGCANSSGLGGLLGGVGSASVAADDLVLDATQLPPGNQGMFYMGDTEVDNPLYDGRQCALGTTFRFLTSIQNSGAPGTMSFTGVVADSGALIQPGTSWIFHCWYRDVPGTPCGTGANLTNAVRVTFLP